MRSIAVSVVLLDANLVVEFDAMSLIMLDALSIVELDAMPFASSCKW